MTPRVLPIATPCINSRCMTRHQSASVTSPSAMARMTSVLACEPELPPLEMMSGMKTDNTTAFAISLSNRPMAVAVSNSPTNSTISQTTRLLSMPRKPTLR